MMVQEAIPRVEKYRWVCSACSGPMYPCILTELGPSSGGTGATRPTGCIRDDTPDWQPATVDWRVQENPFFAPYEISEGG